MFKEIAVLPRKMEDATFRGSERPRTRNVAAAKRDSRGNSHFCGKRNKGAAGSEGAREAA